MNWLYKLWWIEWTDGAWQWMPPPPARRAEMRGSGGTRRAVAPKRAEGGRELWATQARPYYSKHQSNVFRWSRHEALFLQRVLGRHQGRRPAHWHFMYQAAEEADATFQFGVS